jgi:hypothetical protein
MRVKSNKMPQKWDVHLPKNNLFDPHAATPCMLCMFLQACLFVGTGMLVYKIIGPSTRLALSHACVSVHVRNTCKPSSFIVFTTATKIMALQSLLQNTGYQHHQKYSNVCCFQSLSEYGVHGHGKSI